MKTNILIFFIIMVFLGSCGVVSKTRYGNGLHLEWGSGRGSKSLPALTKNYKPVKQNVKKIKPTIIACTQNHLSSPLIAIKTTAGNIPLNNVEQNQSGSWELKDTIFLVKKENQTNRPTKKKEKRKKYQPETELDPYLKMALLLFGLSALGIVLFGPFIQLFVGIVFIYVNPISYLLASAIIALVRLIQYRKMEQTSGVKNSKKWAKAILLGFFYLILLSMLLGSIF